MTLYLVGWNFISQMSDQWKIRSRSSWKSCIPFSRSIPLYSLVSSVNMATVESFVRASGILLIQIKRSMNPRTDLCGIPLLTFLHSEVAESTLTLWIHSVTLRESTPRLFNEGRTTMTTTVLRLAARSSQSNTRGSGPEVLERERGHVTSESGVQRWGSSGPSSLMRKLHI